MANKQKSVIADPTQPSRVEILYMMLADALFSTDTGEPVTVARERVLAGVGGDERADIERLINLRRQYYTLLEDNG